VLLNDSLQILLYGFSFVNSGLQLKVELSIIQRGEIHLLRNFFELDEGVLSVQFILMVHVHNAVEVFKPAV